MKNSKISRFFGRGRKIIFSLALFLLVFAAASVVKIQAAGSVTGWLWGGGTESDGAAPYDGTNTNVGWISMNNTNSGAGGSVSYGVNIPGSDGPITGSNNYAWSENLGWIDFNPSGGGVSVEKHGNDQRLTGRARIVSIAQAGANAGGWQGWIKMDGDGNHWQSGGGNDRCVGTNDYKNDNRCNYGVTIDQDGIFSGYAWSDELGWINFSRASYTPPCTPLCGSAISQTFCSSSSGPSSNLCAPDQGTPSAVSGSGPWNWTCTCGGSSVNCSASVQPVVNGDCGSADGGAFCRGTAPTNADLCSSSAIPSPPASSLDLEPYEVNWTCGGTCGGTTDTCSAKGKKSCGWIETNP